MNYFIVIIYLGIPIYFLSFLPFCTIYFNVCKDKINQILDISAQVSNILVIGKYKKVLWNLKLFDKFKPLKDIAILT